MVQGTYFSAYTFVSAVACRRHTKVAFSPSIAFVNSPVAAKAEVCTLGTHAKSSLCSLSQALPANLVGSEQTGGISYGTLLCKIQSLNGCRAQEQFHEFPKSSNP